MCPSESDATVGLSATATAPHPNDIPEIKEYAAVAERYRCSVVERLVSRYQSIGPLLSKVTVSVGAGSAELLQPYYLYWELRVYEALSQMVLTNLHRSRDAMRSEARPLFRVDVRLSAPEIVLSPAASEIYQILSRFFRNMLDSTRSFLRWRDGSCELTAPVFPDGAEEPVVFSYYDDVVRDGRVTGLVGDLDQEIHAMFSAVGGYIGRWKKYRPLWSLDKAASVTKFGNTQPTSVQYDDKLAFYQNMADEVARHKPLRTVAFVQLCVTPLVSAVRQSALSWVAALGTALRAKAAEEAQALRARMQTWSEELKCEPDSLETLKAVLRSIGDVRDSSLTMQLAMEDVLERYSTVEAYPAIELRDGELADVRSLPAQWERLFSDAGEVDANLIAVKRKFSSITVGQVDTFFQETVALARTFEEEGPGNVGQDLERGLTLMQTFREKLGELADRRTGLTDAQQLFGLSVQAYDELAQVTKAMTALEQIYALYVEQREARAEWSASLWADLNLGVLETGIQGFLQRVKRMPDDVKRLAPWSVLEVRVRDFKDTLPLLADLKSDALRPRHWKKLMQTTGTTFDTNPTTFTLGKVFEMELHKYAETIGEITTCALKELSIEKGLNEVKETWRVTNFTFIKYMQGEQERGLVLGSTEEISLLLDDNAMNLQSMAASRFVGPFRDAVTDWEKKLSVVGEVIDVWIVVQRKWMYLEGEGREGERGRGKQRETVAVLRVVL